MIAFRLLIALLLFAPLQAALSQPPTSSPSSQPTSRSTSPASRPVASQTLPKEATAKQVADAPRPDRSSGVAVLEAPTTGNRLLAIPRALLFVPQLAVRTALLPVRGASYCWERFQIPKRFKDIFFNEAETFGVFPVAFADSGFGLNGGVRLIHRDLFGRRESTTLRASFGGRYTVSVVGSLSSGQRLGRVSLGFAGGYERGPEYGFFGIGNRDEVDRASVVGQIDAIDDDRAVESRFRRDRAFVKLAIGLRLFAQLSVRLTTELRVQDFKPRDDDDQQDDIFLVYRPASLVGLRDGTQDVYTQLQIAFDNRRPTNRYISDAAGGPGLYASAWIGYALGYLGDPSNHFRYALDTQWFINLWRGDRLLVLRLVVDGVSAEMDSIPFTDLPELGGSLLLRGYAFERFRDRIATVGSIEYQYNLNEKVTAYLFGDAGRVYRSWEDFAFRHFRFGFGGGLLLHTKSSLMARLQLASSIDGGFFVSFAFDPVYAQRALREPRK